MAFQSHKDYGIHFKAHVLSLMIILEEKGVATFASDEDKYETYISLSKAWKVQAIWIYNKILEDYNYKSNWNPFHKSSFLAPIEDELKTRMMAHLAVAPSIRFSFSFEKSMAINAYATKKSENYYEVKITLGLIVVLFLLTITVFEDQNGSLTKIKEPVGSEYESIKKAFWLYGEALKNSPFSIFLPKDDWQALLCFSMVSRSLDFILYHECHHILGGHLEMIEAVNNNSLVLNALEYQLIESQADAAATKLLITKWHRLCSTHDFSKSPFILGRGGALNCSQDVYTTVSYSLCISFIALSLQDAPVDLTVKENGNYLIRDHPPTNYRLWRALKLANNFLKNSSEDIRTNIRKSLSTREIATLDNLFLPLKSEEELIEYDNKLNSFNQRVLSFEKGWASKIIKIRPIDEINRPKSFWGWKINPYKKK